MRRQWSATEGPVAFRVQGPIVIKRTLEISREPAHLSVRDDQLVLKRDGQTIGQVPCEDIGVVLVDHPQTTYTHSALAKLAESDAAVVICGRDHLPAAVLLPMADHSQIVWRLDAQLAVGRPLRKQLWRQLTVAKVQAQARNISVDLPAHRKLLALAREVRSGDPTNVEAQAARVYWANWLCESEEPDEPRGSVSNFSEPKLGTDPGPRDPLDFVFRRDPELPGLNSFLNYGYAVLRAAIARSIVAAGLLPSVGLHHRNRSNAFCLADDLIEPLRPLVDDRVRELHRQGYEELNQPAKAALLEILEQRVQFGDEIGPLMVELHRYVGSLVRCFTGDAKELEIPTASSDPCPLHPAP
jgi:CRISPR-associated protein Cas1